MNTELKLRSLKIIQNYSQEWVNTRGKVKKNNFCQKKYLPVYSVIFHSLNVKVARYFGALFASVGRNLTNAIDSTCYPIVNDSD